MTAPKISLIVPVYRSAAYLPDCIRGVFDQTFPDWECILVDDGSPDESPAICDAAAEKDPRFRVIHQKNKGVSAARNAGMDAAKGQYLLFCDGDDVIAPAAMELALKAQQQNPQDLVCWTLCRKLEELPLDSAEPEQKLFSAQQAGLYHTTIPGHSNCNKLFCAELLKKAELRYDESLARAEDYEFGGRYLDAFFAQEPKGCIRQLEAPLYFWRDTAGSATHAQANTKNPKQAIQYDPKEFPHYAEKMMQEYREARAAADGWTFLSREELLPQIRTYLRRFAFAVWTAHQLGESLPADFLSGGEVGECLAILKKERAYSVYYLPFRLKNKWLLRRLYESDETGAQGLYRLCYTAGYYSLLLCTGARWQQP